MNKRLKEATKEEIKEAYQNNAIGIIAKKRKEHNIKSIDDDGVIINESYYGRPQAREENLLFEFRLWSSNKMRKNRLKTRISAMIATGRAIFLTLTFNDKFFERGTSPDTRRRYVSRFLKEQCKVYVANIDFGELNGREHYHAVVVPKFGGINFQPYCDFFDGSRIHGEPIRPSGKSATSVSLYINKLTNHALKDNGHYKRLIYSRG